MRRKSDCWRVRSSLKIGPILKAEPLAPKGCKPFGARELLPYRSIALRARYAIGPKPAHEQAVPQSRIA